MFVALPLLSALFADDVVADVDVDSTAFEPAELGLEASGLFVSLVHFEGFKALLVVTLGAVAVAANVILNRRNEANHAFPGWGLL